jgi:hypothetical protein
VGRLHEPFTSPVRVSGYWFIIVGSPDGFIDTATVQREATPEGQEGSDLLVQLILSDRVCLFSFPAFDGHPRRRSGGAAMTTEIREEAITECRSVSSEQERAISRAELAATSSEKILTLPFVEYRARALEHGQKYGAKASASVYSYRTISNDQSSLWY